MSDNYTTQHGREVKKSGRGEATKSGLQRLRAAREGGDKRTDQYQVEGTKKIFDEIDADEYERIQDQRKNDDFIVDDDGYGYRDHGGEIWDRDADHEEGGKRKKRKIDPNEPNIMHYMLPASTIKKKTAQGANQSAVSQKPKVSVEQSKDIMNNLFQELDAKDVDELEDVNASAAILAQEMNKPIAFNRQDELTNKYAITLESRQEVEAKRQSEQLRQEAMIGQNQMPANPFSKKRKFDDFQGIPTTNQNQGSSANKRQNNEVQVNPVSNNTSYFDARSSLGDADTGVVNNLNRSNVEDYHSALDDSHNMMMTDSHPAQQNNFNNSRSMQQQQFQSNRPSNQSAVSFNKNQIPQEQANDEWQKIKEKNFNANQELRNMDANMVSNQQDYPLPFNEDGTLSFYWIDAHEENNGADLYIFGKIYQHEERQYVSCSIKVNGMQRELYALAKMKGKARGAMTTEEESQQVRSVMMELDDIRKKRFPAITKWRCKPVTRKYAFEMPIQHGEHQFLKIKYDAQMPSLPSTVQGNTFECIFGANQSMLELFILKRKIKGPCWMTVKNASKVGDFKKTWCRQEIIVSNPKDIEITLDDLNRQDLPTLNSLTFSFKTTRAQQNTHEIAMISCIVNKNINQEGPSQIDQNQCFTLLRRLEGKPIPFDFEQKLKLKKDSVISYFQNERQMIEAFISKVYQIDPDLVVAHNLCGGMFDLLLARIQYLKVNHWSRIGRLKKTQIPNKKVDQGGSSYGGSQWIPRQVTCGRLLVDTFLSAKELIRETNYDLTHLAKVQLKQNRQDFDDDLLPTFYVFSEKLFKLIEHTERDAYLTLMLMNHLQVIPLTKQLTNIAGNLWFRSLQNARAERNEMLLLHEFKKKKFVLPDKKQPTARDLKRNFFADENEEIDTTAKGGKGGKRKKAAYAGGLVIEPKAGFYDNIILLLDFNSLYPSIIQEYNLCFTTVNRRPTKNFDGSEVRNQFKKVTAPGEEEQEDVEEAELPDKSVNLKDAVLPNVLRDLVQKRKAVKDKMKNEKDAVKLSQLEIRQKAIKLTANSMYGCLGFSSSRFHAQAIAALITRTGRETLLRTKDIAENKLGFNVVYGDTDSIMINTGSNQLQQSLEMGKRLKAEVNCLYKCLEIEIDGVFKSLLLLKKKKYAALKYENFGTADAKVVQEVKGLDMVRRDWCPLSKTVGNYVLDQILSGKQREEVVMNLNEFLSDIGNKLKENKITLDQFIITKQLTKAIADYTDIKSQPHVAVAKRLREQGKSEADLVNNFIPYVISAQPFDPAKQNPNLADKAYHPDEIVNSKGKINCDIDWYITQQVLPPITRLIEHIDGIEVEFVAQCLGVDPKKYKYHSEKKTADINNDDGGLIQNPILTTETERSLKNRTIAELQLKCPHCSHSYQFPGIFQEGKNKDISGLMCMNCNQRIPDAYLQNRINLFLKQLVSVYYQGKKQCQEPSCNALTQQLLYHNKCVNLVCKGKMVAEFSEGRVNDTLRYLQGLFNVKKYIIENQKAGFKYEQVEDVPNFDSFKQLQDKVDTVMKRSKFNKVDLGNIFSFMKLGQATAANANQKMSIF